VAQLPIDAEQPTCLRIGLGYAGPGKFKNSAEIGFALLERLVCQFFLGGVTHHFNVADQISGFISQRLDEAGGPKPGAIFPHLPPKISDASSGSGVLEFALRHATLPVFGREEDSKVFSHNFFLRVAKYLLRPRVPTESAPFEVKSDYRMIGHALHH